MTALRAALLLTLDLIRRFVREGVVLRSLVFPIVLAAGAMGATVAVVSYTRAPATLALDSALEADALEEEVRAGGWPVARVANPEAWVRDGRALIGTDGATMWISRSSTEALEIEGILRAHLPSSWRPSVQSRKRGATRSARGARILLQFIGGLFAFYGVVFGAGSVARDRDEGTLEAEMALPVPAWVPGFSRWAAGSVLLAVFFSLAVAVFDGLLGLRNPEVVWLHGLAACLGSTAIGLGVIGRASLATGFAGPLSAGLVTVVSLLSAGVTVRSVAWALPVSSLVARSADGWTPLAVSVVWGLVATWVFARRSTVA